MTTTPVVTASSHFDNEWSVEFIPNQASDLPNTWCRVIHRPEARQPWAVYSRFGKKMLNRHSVLFTQAVQAVKDHLAAQ